ncbi:MAG: 6-hydroxymethylpterin diphosphokinase MptE-like protein, partial [Desulfosporosinus sp.]
KGFFMNYFENNLLAIRNGKEQVASLLRDKEFSSSRLQLIEANKNAFTVKMHTDNRWIHINSRLDPVREAASRVSIIDFRKLTLMLIMGMGLGYEVMEIWQKKDTVTKLLIIENDLELLKAAFTINDLSGLLADENVYLIAGNESNIRTALQEYLPNLVQYIGNLDIYQHPVLKTVYWDEYKTLRKLFADLAFNCYTLGGNDALDTLHGLVNDINNFSYMLDTFDLAKLRPYYAGLPAYCVASGSSLYKNMHLLKTVKDRALILCAESTLSVLLKNGIMPDVVSVLERGIEHYEKHFKNKDFGNEVVLIGQSVIEKEIFQDYSGEKIICLKENTALERWFKDMVQDIICFDSGISSSNMNVAIAEVLGCSPIIFVGQDLAYSEEGSTHSHYVEDKDHRMDLDAPANMENEVKWVPSISGGMVRTNWFWDSTRIWIENNIAKNSGTIYINATEGGANIIGTQVMPLQESIRRYVNFQTDRNFLELIKEQKKIGRQDKGQIYRNFKLAISENLTMARELVDFIDNNMELQLEIKDAAKRQSLNEKYIQEFRRINAVFYEIIQKNKPLMQVLQAILLAKTIKLRPLANLESYEEFLKWNEIYIKLMEEVKAITKLYIDILQLGLQVVNTQAV